MYYCVHVENTRTGRYEVHHLARRDLVAVTYVVSANIVKMRVCGRGSKQSTEARQPNRRSCEKYEFEGHLMYGVYTI